MCLDNLRTEIDKINLQILDALKKRQELGVFIALNKKKQSLPIKDSVREEKMLTHLKEEAEKRELDSTFAEKLFKVIIEETIRVEESQ